jgi:GMP synthase PP-ATPase subunit
VGTRQRIVGDAFIRVFTEQAHELRAQGGPIEFLAQGPRYPDVIENTSHGTATRFSCSTSARNIPA